MIPHSIETLKKWASQCSDVEFYAFTDCDTRIHTDTVRSLEDVTFDDLPPEFPCEYMEADEETYQHTILANTGIDADFQEWYGSKDAKIAIIVLPSTYHRSACAKYEVYPDLYSGNDLQDALYFARYHEHAILTVDGLEVDASVMYNSLDHIQRAEINLHAVADTHVRVTSFIEQDASTLYLFETGDTLSVKSAALVHHANEFDVFHLRDWQGPRPETYSEIPSFEWVVGVHSRPAIILDGLPRYSPFEGHFSC